MDGPRGVAAGDKTVSLGRLKQIFRRVKGSATEISAYWRGGGESAIFGRSFYCQKRETKILHYLVSGFLSLLPSISHLLDEYSPGLGSKPFFSPSCVRTLPNEHMESVVETIRKFNITALLVIGGFEVESSTNLLKELGLK